MNTGNKEVTSIPNMAVNLQIVQDLKSVVNIAATI